MLSKLFAFCQGRHTFFALLFTVIGTVLAFLHSLDSNFVALVIALQAFVLGHSWKEDHMPKTDDVVVNNGGDNGATK